MKRLLKPNNQKGFTMAELLIVVAIIAVLVAIAIPVFNKQLEKSREAYDIATMRQAASAAIDIYYAGIKDETSADNAGFQWFDKHDAKRTNAAGVYDPKTGKFYSKKYINNSSKFPAYLKQGYGKGTSVDGKTTFSLGVNSNTYASDEDYRDAVCMVSIYPEASPAHVDVYWKKIKNGSNYIGSDDGPDNPKYCIRININ